jgi:hypothetical protein
MGAGGMGTGSCPMMSGMDMTGMGGMSGNSTMLGMDMTGMSGYVTQESTSVFNNPWMLIGWVLLGLLVIALLVGIVFGIVWLIRYPKQTHPA